MSELQGPQESRAQLHFVAGQLVIKDKLQDVRLGRAVNKLQVMIPMEK